MTDYRDIFNRLRYRILADHATVIHSMDGGEVHLVLLQDISNGDFGFIILGQRYDDTYAPITSDDPDGFVRVLEDRISWHKNATYCYRFFTEDAGPDSRWWMAHRVGRDNPELVISFLADVLTLLEKKFDTHSYLQNS